MTDLSRPLRDSKEINAGLTMERMSYSPEVSNRPVGPLECKSEEPQNEGIVSMDSYWH
jgi:hypothetical protein